MLANTHVGPWPCIADGVMLAINMCPGQGTLRIAPEKDPPGMLAVIVVRNRKTGSAYGTKRTSQAHFVMSANDPDQTSFINPSFQLLQLRLARLYCFEII